MGLFCVLGLVFAVFYIIIAAAQRYWKAWKSIQNCGFPVVPSRNWLLGNLDVTKSHTTPWQLSELTKKYGHTYGLMQGSNPTIVTSDPEVIHQICFKQFHLFHSRIVDPASSHPDSTYGVHEFEARGKRWKRIRSLTSKAVSNENLRKLFNIMEDSVNHFMVDLESEINNSKALELHSHFQRLTFDVISRCCMGRSYSSQHDDPNLGFLLKKFSPLQSFHLLFLFTWCIPELKWLASTYEKLCFHLQSAFRLEIDPLISYTKYLRNISSSDTPTQDRSSFLHKMKNVEDKEWNDWAVDASGPCDVSSLKIIHKLTCGEIVSQCRFLTSAGFDTTANTLAYLTYLLANDPQQQEKLYHEIETLDEITFDSVQRLSNLHRAIMETLRLFPHASLLQTRVCAQQCQIGSFTFQMGVGVIFDTWSLHHSRQIWGDDVEEFRPDRFLEPTKLQTQSWMPFGAGPRQCIGMRFALLETKTTICYLLKKFRLCKAENSCKICVSVREMGTVWPTSAKIILEKRAGEYLKAFIKLKCKSKA